MGLINGREVGLRRMGLISEKPKQWVEEGRGGFDNETQRNLELGSTMKPTKSRETQAYRRWVSVEMEAWVEGVDRRLGAWVGLGQ